MASLNRQIVLFFSSFIAVSIPAFEDHKSEHEHVFTPEEERVFVEQFSNELELNESFRFPQTQWDECAFDPRGNYSGIGCARTRQISVILKSYLATHVYACVDSGLTALGLPAAETVHLVHDGILGDQRHSPRSMHAEARAIDIRSIQVKLVNGLSRSFVFDDSNSRPFFRAFRNCWGQVIFRQNSCPYFEGSVDRTGTIGWEDADHQHHMHTSVPHCVNGQYGDYFYRR